MQVRPAQQIYVSYIIPNPSDANTYYPQAVVKNTQTGAIIATINLTQDATELLRYTGSFISPADSTGNGYFLDVVTIPYTDSAHTTPSQNYGAAWNQYFVWQPPPYYGGGDVAIIDYDRVGTIIDDRIGKIKMPKEQKFDFPAIQAPKDVDFKPVFLELGNIRADLSETSKRIDGLPKPKETDLRPVHKHLDETHDKISLMLTQHKASIADMLEEHRMSVVEMHQKGIAGLREEMDRELNKYADSAVQVVFHNKAQEEPKKLPKREMLRHLTREINT